MTEPDHPDSLIAALQSRNWADYFAARQMLVALGGEAAEPLSRLAADEAHPLRAIALELLTYIEQETTLRFAGRLAQLLCPRCLTRFDAHSVNLPWGVSFTYYSCRACRQSREFLEGVKRVVAVLDTVWPEQQLRQKSSLRVNWLTRPGLFDFDRVEIIHAADQDAERFAIQVGNDTDPYRKPRYSQMTCMIGPDCQLSENTLRILEHTFGVITHAPHL
ncbi:MAG: hypothetical protein DPW09_12740 [Anaerolineae bacterium]|nr:hypothetical protein [Anaerolineales bacterium]MCQ3974307.1 hypothetical protein [Anaerolineae bacterium]